MLHADDGALPERVREDSGGDPGLQGVPHRQDSQVHCPNGS